MTDSPQRLKVGFIMSTEVGWKTQYLNWRNGLSPETGVDPVWIPINWWKEGGLIERTPGLPSGVKARLRSQLEIREGLDKGPFDALYVGVGHVLHGGKWFLQKQPYFITTDVTPLQLKDFGDLYGITGSRFPLYENRKHLGWVDRYKNAAGIFACSHWAAQSLINDYGLDPWRVYVLPPGIDTNKWQFPERELTDTLNILFVGGDFLRKGGDLLLKWAANTRFINWRMDIVTRDEVHNNDPRITVHHGLGPNDPALMELYRTANIFALPTRGDCYSLAGMEGLSSGLPVILSRTGGTGDIIRDGETGYLIGPGAGDELADRLDHLLANPEECVRMGRLGRQDAVERFDAITNINRTIEKIRAVLESSKQVPVPPLKATAIAAEPEKMIRVGFVMSTEVGWKTQYLNWREGLTPAMMVTPEWIVINWWDQKGVLEHIPLLPPGVKARIRSRMELHKGIVKGPFDALFVGVGHVLHGQQSLLQKQPYFITSDVTPKQLHEFGQLYGIMRTRFELYERKKFQGWRQRYRNAAALFPWSNWAADSMINDYGADPSRVHVIPPGVVIDDWATDRSIKNPSEKVHILFVGGEFFRKGGDLLLDWAATTKLKNWHLHLVTQRKVINTDTRVTVHNGLSPNDPALMQLFRDADIFALPTRGDCYSIAAIEAMATGLPVILSLTGGTGDIIRDGVTGYLIEPENVVDLKEKLETLIADPEARFSMGLAARQDVEARYDATRNIQQTLTIMRKTLGQ